ncbi:helix-turn-helix domain-containing protein [Flavobacterium hydrophilum]|nr:helix-turn-helix domain-containing protein [Flavobacterium hydrophilum]
MEEIKKMLREPIQKLVFKEKISFNDALDLLSQNGYNISRSKLYKLTSTNSIPHGKINNKLVFFRDELILWIENQILKNESRKNNSVIYSAISKSKRQYKDGNR